MASSVKILLRKKSNKDNLFPIVIRITQDRKSTFIYTGQYIDIKHWDETNRKVKKSHPNSARLNHLILAKLTEANKALLDMQSEKTNLSAQHIKQEITSPITKKSFNEVADEYLNELQKRQKFTQGASDKVRINHVIEYANSKQLLFQQIDEKFLRDFRVFLKTKKDNSERSIINHYVVIRSLFNRAMRMGIVDQNYYPFGKNKIRIKFPETKKVGLSHEEIKQLELLENLSQQERHALNVWLFSFYLAGMRVGDVLMIRWSNIYDGRLHYTMNKNDKLLSFKLPQKILPILDHYKPFQTKPDDFVFPEMKKADENNLKDQFTKTKTATKKFNKYLVSIAKKVEISKKLTMHIARHSFGNIAGDKIPIQMLQKLYRHSSITTTINYQQNFMHQETDEALDKVINF